MGDTVSFAWLGVGVPAQWRAAIALYILGLVSYQGAQTFWGAAFPGLARDLPEVKESLEKANEGNKSMQEHVEFDSLARNRISNMYFAICSAGEVVTLAIIVGILEALKSS